MTLDTTSTTIGSRWYWILFLLTPALITLVIKRLRIRSGPIPRVPVSVIFFFTWRCNAECSFCFHTAKTSYVAPLEDAKRGLALLKRAGMKKLNLAGGEPFLYKKYMAE